MISRIKGTLVARDLDRIEVETPGGVIYEVEIPLTILQRLPSPPAENFEIRTLQVVREESLTLYGFSEDHERELFRRLLGATGVGPKMALAMLSTYNAPRLAQALAEKDLAALTQVSGVGKKTAERIALELADRVQDLVVAGEGVAAGGVGYAEEAVAALVHLGYTFVDADAAIRQALEQGEPEGREELIRRALSNE
ncbi:MAG: Holliday junction branch migration protein RuvA [Longimicrobiales bacterium]